MRLFMPQGCDWIHAGRFERSTRAPATGPRKMDVSVALHGVEKAIRLNEGSTASQSPMLLIKRAGQRAKKTACAAPG